MGNTSSSSRRSPKASRSNSRISLPIPGSVPNTTSAPGSAIPLIVGSRRDSSSPTAHQENQNRNQEQEREVKGVRVPESTQQVIRDVVHDTNAERESERVNGHEGAVTFGDRPISEALMKMMPGAMKSTPPSGSPPKSPQIQPQPQPQPEIPSPSPLPSLSPSPSPYQPEPTPQPQPLNSETTPSPEQEPQPQRRPSPTRAVTANEWNDEERESEEGEEEESDTEQRRTSATIGDMQDMLKRAEREALATRGKGGLRWDGDVDSENAKTAAEAPGAFPIGEESRAWAEHEVEKDVSERNEVEQEQEREEVPRAVKRKRGDDTPVDDTRMTFRPRSEVEAEESSSGESDSESSSAHDEESSVSSDSVEEQDLGERRVGSDENIPVPHGPFESVYYEPTSATSSPTSSSSGELNSVFSPPHFDKESEVAVHHGPTIVTSRSRSPSPSGSPNPYAIALPQTPQQRTPHTPVSAIHLPSAGHFLPLAYSSRHPSYSPDHDHGHEHEHEHLHPDDSKTSPSPSPRVHAGPFPPPPPIVNTDIISVAAPIPPARPTRPAHAREDTVYFPAEPELHVDSVVEEMMTAAPVPTLDPSLTIDEDSSLSPSHPIDQDPYGDLAHTPIRPHATDKDGHHVDMFHFFTGATEQSQLPSPTSSNEFLDHQDQQDRDREAEFDRYSLPDFYREVEEGSEAKLSPSYGELAERLQLSRSQVSVGRSPSLAPPQLPEQHPSPSAVLEQSFRLEPKVQEPEPVVVVEPQQPPSPALSGRSPDQLPTVSPPIISPVPEPKERGMGVLEAGVYLMSDERWDTSVDLHGGDHKSAIAFGHHGGDNQQWEFVPLGEGFAIRSLKNSTWMCVEGEVVQNAAVVTSKFPVAWDVEVVESSEEDEDVVVKIHWPNSNLLFGLADTKPGTQVRLTNIMQHDVSKCWRLRPRVSSGQVVSSFETQQQRQDGDAMTVTTTTTTTTVKTVTKVMRKGTY